MNIAEARARIQLLEEKSKAVTALIETFQREESDVDLRDEVVLDLRALVLSVYETELKQLNAREVSDGVEEAAKKGKERSEGAVSKGATRARSRKSA